MSASGQKQTFAVQDRPFKAKKIELDCGPICTRAVRSLWAKRGID